MGQVVVYYENMDNKTATMTLTAKHYDDVINNFYDEMSVSTQERMIEIQEVINILLEEKAKRGL